MTDDRALAEIVAEGRRQMANFGTVIFRWEDAARLLAVAEAAAEWRRDTRDDADARLAAVVDDAALAARGGGE